jgi:hypothetical protein
MSSGLGLVDSSTHPWSHPPGLNHKLNRSFGNWPNLAYSLRYLNWVPSNLLVAHSIFNTLQEHAMNMQCQPLILDAVHLKQPGSPVKDFFENKV